MNDMNFLSMLNRYFNYGYMDKPGKLISILSPAISINLSANSIKENFNKVPSAILAKTPLTRELPEYNGNDKGVLALNKFISTHLADEIAYAMVHGSFATGEETNYSDFDGLIILKDEIFSDKKKITKVAQFLNQSFKMMLTIDPHQHHGWMVLTEKHLADWPCSFFPSAILEHSQILKGFPTSLSIRYDEDKHYADKNFFTHCDKLIQKLNNGWPENTFQLKSLFSEFMLTPALFIQTKNKKGIFKKESFDMAARFFTDDEFSAMNEISGIRKDWPKFKNETIMQGYFTPITRQQQIKDQSVLPDKIKCRLNKELSDRMISLLQLFKNRLK